MPESADWYESSYFIVWGTNLPMTRTPDAHFYTEARYRGARVAAVAPDYAEYVKFADTWLPAKAGTDAALAMAMTHVIVKEFYIERKVPYFMDYARQYTDLPFLVVLTPKADRHVPGRFLRAADLGLETPNAAWKTVVCDARDRSLQVPNGSIGFRWSEEGRWNLKLEENGHQIDPLLSLAEAADAWSTASFTLFAADGAGTRQGLVPTLSVNTPSGELRVTTVFDLMAAHQGVQLPGAPEAFADYPSDYDDPQPYTPAWQEAITGVPRADAIRVAREFAANAEQTRGKSMIFLGAGTNHWFHSDMIYRAIINLTTLCGCQGVNGGGWAHYVGQEKVRPQAAWSQVAFGLDWRRPPRQQNGTSFYYFASDQWDYDYAQLIESPARTHQPAIRPRSQLTGEPLDLKWGPNWEDDLAGLATTGGGDVNFKNLEVATYLQFRNVFMFWLPRLCEHCLNPACVASCPSGALYKREEDGIVLVDQERCRGWRYCVSGCPYKKVYFNWHTGRAEKCLFCYPRTEAGQTTLCAHSCVGRIRYVGVLLYDAERIARAAAAPADQAVYPAQMEMLLDPEDPEVQRAAKAQGLADNVLAAALARLQHGYDAAGWERTTGDLPDYLPLMLEFLTLCPEGDANQEIWDCLESMEKIIAPLAHTAPAYAELLRPLGRAIRKF